MSLINIKNLIRVTILIILSSTATLYADPNALLGDAIKTNASINENMPQQDRIAAYGKVFEALDEIISKHSSSDQAIKLLSNQSIGDFDQNLIRNRYIKDLTEYYDIVCETSPNYSCLGFVSLKMGQDSCKTANTVRDIIEAHQNIKNAVYVFSGQNSDESFVNISLNQYRNCLSESPFQVTDYSKDLFSSDLVDMLLQLENESLATAIIQNMKTPAFKVTGVLALSEYQGKTFDKAFNDRLVKFIDEKVEDVNGSKADAGLELANAAFTWGENRISYDDLRKYISYAKSASTDGCDPFIVRNFLEKILAFQNNVVSLDKERRDYNKGQLPGFLSEMGGKGILDACFDRSSQTKEYSTSLKINANLLLLSKEAAEEFQRGVLNEDWNMFKQFDYMVGVLGGYQELFEAEFGLRDKAQGSDVVKFEGLLKDERALFPAFKQIVYYGDVCESSKILFQQIKGKNFYDDAIEYMINSDSMDMNAENNCGDSELELLLN